MSFNGSFEHKLDSKGRIVVPSCFRDELGEHIVITSMDQEYISVYSKENWQKAVVSRVEENALKTLNGADAKRIIMSLSFSVEVDSAGRMLLPEKMRKDVSIVQDVVIVGNTNKIEVWDSARWHKYIAEKESLLLAEVHQLLLGL
ncbi:MAG: division/cell wall cluster transcriptional repressor MraZ [Synergistaceae bacterium]|jgi:MraZ protein|nr:division/cell wall cluster transcriptional repressor MraZ [Synergistaceae bacterium]